MTARAVAPEPEPSDVITTLALVYPLPGALTRSLVITPPATVTFASVTVAPVPSPVMVTVKLSDAE